MPSNSYKSPFASAFKSAMKRGVPCSEAICNIAKKSNKTPKTVMNSLCKAGLCYSQKFNGTLLCWPCENGKSKATTYKACQVNMWQCFVDWCICSGTCTPEQMKNVCSSQSEFMKACRKWWNAQFKSASKSTTKRRRPATKSRKRTTTARKSNAKRSTTASRKRTTARKNSSPRSRSTANSRKSRTTSVRSRNSAANRRKSSTSSRRRTVRRAA